MKSCNQSNPYTNGSLNKTAAGARGRACAPNIAVCGLRHAAYCGPHHVHDTVQWVTVGGVKSRHTGRVCRVCGVAYACPAARRRLVLFASATHAACFCLQRIATRRKYYTLRVTLSYAILNLSFTGYKIRL